jgi:hypothetical protein
MLCLFSASFGLVSNEQLHSAVVVVEQTLCFATRLKLLRVHSFRMYPIAFLSFAFTLLLMQAELVSAHSLWGHNPRGSEEAACDKLEKFTTEVRLKMARKDYVLTMIVVVFTKHET